MRRTMIIIGWISVVSCFLSCAIFLSSYFVEAQDFEIKTGKIKGELEFSTDEYKKVTGVSFFLEDEPVKYSLPGKLLAKDFENIQSLQENDEVQIHVKKADKMSFWERGLSDSKLIIGSIGKKGEEPYVSLEDTIAFRTSVSTLVWAIFFFGMGVVIAVYLW